MKKIILVLALMGCAGVSAGQDSHAKAEALLDNAIGKAVESGNVAVYFEGLATGLEDPSGIFRLPVYHIIRGGYFLMSGSKYEVQMGPYKTLCDGRLLVVVDELSKTMVVDSVRDRSLKGNTPDLQALVSESIGEGKLSYEGTETVNGKKCHKIKAVFTKGKIPFVLYWVSERGGQLYLMAEKRGAGFDVYWFRDLGKVPAGHEFSVNLPRREIDKFYGYSVIDNRFSTVSSLSSKK